MILHLGQPLPTLMTPSSIGWGSGGKVFSTITFSCQQKKRQKANSVDVEQKTRKKKERGTSSPSPIPSDRSERNGSATSDPSPSDQLSSLHPPPSPVKCSSRPCSPAKQPSVPRSPAKNPSPVKSSPVVSQPSSPSLTTPLDRHGDTSQEGTTVR